MEELPARRPERATRVTAGAAPATMLLVGVLAVAANLRPLAVIVGPLLHQLRASEHLSGSVAGLLTTIPVLCFGVMAPVAGVLSRRLGIARTIALLLAAITAGQLLRVAGGVGLLLAGTTIAASGAACGNVLLPVLVRRSFSHSVGRISALYTTVLVGTAALSAGVAVPLASALGHGWRGGLAIWALPCALAFVLWLPQLRHEPAPGVSTAARVRIRDVTRDPLTWQLTLFFAMQSWGFYATLAWLPSLFQSHGLSSSAAGLLLGLSGLVSVPVSLLTPAFAVRHRQQGALAVAVAAITALGFLGLLLAPATAPELWVVLLGLGQGATFPLALTMIVLRSGTTQLTAEVSTHVQGGGYLLAATGPLLIGVLHDVSGGWSLSVIALMVALVPQALCGAAAGRDRIVLAGRGQRAG